MCDAVATCENRQMTDPGALQGRVAVITAPAKLTLSLRITGVREDGWHLIDAEMTTIALGDEITISETPGTPTAIGVEGEFAAGVPVDGSNLVARALHLVGRTADVRITKNVPHGGGLGGGSADAAAVLRWAGRTGRDTADLRMAARLGADVPFCLVGGRARVSGIGEVVEPLPRNDRDFTLIIPPVAVPTPLAYRAWDELGGPVGDPSGNDLEPAALLVEPELGDWKRRIHDAAGVAPTLAGSGATWFLDGHRPDIARRLEGARVILTRTTGD